MKKIIAIALILVCVFSFTACTTDAPKEVDLEKVMQDINTQCNITNAQALEIEDLASYYLIMESSVKAFSAEIDTTGITEIVLVEAISEEAAASVATELDKRLQSKVSEAASYEAELLDIVKNAEVKTNGNYVSMIVCDDIDKANEVYEQAFA